MCASNTAYESDKFSPFARDTKVREIMRSDCYSNRQIVWKATSLGIFQRSLMRDTRCTSRSDKELRREPATSSRREHLTSHSLHVKTRSKVYRGSGETRSENATERKERNERREGKRKLRRANDTKAERGVRENEMKGYISPYRVIR